MARSITSVAAGRVNARFLLLALILAAISAVLVYAGITRSSGDEGSSAVVIDVVVAQQPIDIGQELTADVLAVRALPADAVGENPVTSIESIVGERALQPIAAGEPILSSKVVGTADFAASDAIAARVSEGMRGMAINVKEVVSYGGLALPGDRVDIYWVPSDKTRIVNDHEGAVLIAEDVEVLAVQQTLVGLGPQDAAVEDQPADDEAAQAGTERVRDPNATTQPGAITVTLLLSPQQAARVFCAETGGELRLAVRGFGDETPSGQAQGQCIIPADQPAEPPAQD